CLEFISVPADGSFVEIDEDLFGLEIFFESPGAQLAAKAGLLVAAPGSFDIRWLHVIDPNNTGTQGFDDAEGFIDIASPDRGGQAVGSVVGDANGFGFAVKGNHAGDGAKNFFASDACGVLDIIKNRGLEVVAFGELLRAAATDGELGFFFAELEIG